MSLELAVILLLIRAYRLERDLGLPSILPLVFVGFLAHAWLPSRWRVPAFLALTLVAIAIVLPPLQACGLVVLGLGLIAVCHLPVGWGLRVGMLLVAGALLAAIRVEWIALPWKTIPTVVLPVLGAMFMFRLVLYMRELRREKEPASVWQRVAYFFLLPNVVFLLVPIVDYRTYLRT